MDRADIENRFRHHPPTTREHVEAHENTREAFRDLAHRMNDTLPEGQETEHDVRSDVTLLTPEGSV